MQASVAMPLRTHRDWSAVWEQICCCLGCFGSGSKPSFELVQLAFYCLGRSSYADHQHPGAFLTAGCKPGDREPRAWKTKANLSRQIVTRRQIVADPRVGVGLARQNRDLLASMIIRAKPKFRLQQKREASRLRRSYLWLA